MGFLPPGRDLYEMASNAWAFGMDSRWFLELARRQQMHDNDDGPCAEGADGGSSPGATVTQVQKLRALQGLLGAESYQSVAQQFGPSLGMPVAPDRDQAMLETLVLRALARPFNYWGRVEPHIWAISGVHPTPDGLEIVTSSRRTAVFLAAHTMGVMDVPGEGTRLVSVRLDAVEPTVDLTLGRASVRVRVSEPERGNSGPLSAGDLAEPYPDPEPCARMTSVFGLHWSSEDTDPHGCDPAYPAHVVLWSETELALDLSRFLRTLPALLGVGRCGFDTWADSFELAPVAPGIWGAWDLVAVLLLFGVDPARVQKGTRMVDVGLVRVLEFDSLKEPTAAQQRALQELPRAAELDPGLLDRRRIGRDGEPRPAPISVLPRPLVNQLSPWLWKNLS